MLRSRYFLVTMISVAVTSVFILLIAVGFLPPSPVDQTVTPINVQDPLVERVDPKVDAGASNSPATEPAVSQVTPLQDGQSLLESYCTQCHLAQLLEEVNKSRSDWEKTLAQMESMGVHLDDAEKVILLDYLAGAARP